MSDFRHAPVSCPRCQARLDAGTHPAGQALPDDGDPTVCVYCGLVLVFQGGRPREPRDDELDQLDDEDRVQLQQVLDMVQDERTNPLWGRWPNGQGPRPAPGKGGFAA